MQQKKPRPCKGPWREAEATYQLRRRAEQLASQCPCRLCLVLQLLPSTSGKFLVFNGQECITSALSSTCIPNSCSARINASCLQASGLCQAPNTAKPFIEGAFGKRGTWLDFILYYQYSQSLLWLLVACFLAGRRLQQQLVKRLESFQSGSNGVLSWGQRCWQLAQESSERLLQLSQELSVKTRWEPEPCQPVFSKEAYYLRQVPVVQLAWELETVAVTTSLVRDKTFTGKQTLLAWDGLAAQSRISSGATSKWLR